MFPISVIIGDSRDVAGNRNRAKALSSQVKLHFHLGLLHQQLIKHHLASHLRHQLRLVATADFYRITRRGALSNKCIASHPQTTTCPRSALNSVWVFVVMAFLNRQKSVKSVPMVEHPRILNS